MQGKEDEQVMGVTPTSISTGSTAGLLSALREVLGQVLGHSPTSVKWG